MALNILKRDPAPRKRDGWHFDVASWVEKWDDPDAWRRGESGLLSPPTPGNLALNAGLALNLDLLIGAGGTAYNNTNARIGVGNSSTAAAATQTDLQDATAEWKAMDATFPSRTNQTLTFRSTFTEAEANFAWNEWGIGNAAGGGTLLNRKVTSFGTKTVGAIWQLTVTLTAS